MRQKQVMNIAKQLTRTVFRSNIARSLRESILYPQQNKAQSRPDFFNILYTKEPNFLLGCIVSCCNTRTSSNNTQAVSDYRGKSPLPRRYTIQSCLSTSSMVKIAGSEWSQLNRRYDASIFCSLRVRRRLARHKLLTHAADHLRDRLVLISSIQRFISARMTSIRRMPFCSSLRTIIATSAINALRILRGVEFPVVISQIGHVIALTELPPNAR